MNEGIQAVLILGTIFGFIYAIVHLNVRRKERMALIAKGADPSLFHEKIRTRVTSLRYGLLFVGLGIGILLGNLLEAVADFTPEVAYFSMTFIFGGIALIISYFVGKRLEEQEKE
jgi:hypothetical protein